MSRPFDPMTLPPAGVWLIEASAGTGKTYSITSLYLRFLLEQRLGVERILVVTFTEAATAELHERIRVRLQKAIHVFERGAAGEDQVLAALLKRSPNRATDLLLLQRALAEIDEAAVTTIHGFCHRMLQQGAFEGGMPFDLELVGQVDDLLLELTQDYLARVSHDEDYRLVALLYEACSLDELHGLAREAVRHREFSVIGIDHGQPREQRLAEVAAAYSAARKAWREEEEAVRSRIVGAGLTKPFRRKIEGGLLVRLAEHLAEEVPRSFVVPGGTEDLIPEGFADAGRKVCTATAIKQDKVPRHSFFGRWQEYLAALARLERDYLAEILAGLSDFVRSELPLRLYRAQRQSFDDLLHGLDSALARQGGQVLAALIRDKYPVALIDEFQDTDPVQYRIFQAVYGETPQTTGLYLIGDPKQAIYAFRGADIFAYLKAADDAGANRHTMITNWRADAAMINALNRLFQGVEQPFLESRIVFQPVQPGSAGGAAWHGADHWQAPLQFLAVPREHPAGRNGRISVTDLDEMIPASIARDIVRLLRSGAAIDNRPVRPADIAVLVRTNRQAAEMQQALKRHGVAAVLHSRASVFASHEARELLLLLRAVAEPALSMRLRSALVTEYLGLTADDLMTAETDEASWQGWFDRFARWHLLWRDHGFMRMMQRLCEETGLAARLLGLADGERRLTNLRHLVELLEAYEQQKHCRPASLCSWLAEQCRAGGSGEESELRLESDSDAVQLVTIHRSKGLEYPVVYCPYLWEGVGRRRAAGFTTFHDPQADWAGRIVLFPGAEHLALKQREDFAEALRLLYVAMTRAKYCCIVAWAGAAAYSSSPLAYLLHGQASPAAGADDLADWFAHLDGFSHAELYGDLAERSAREEGFCVRPLDGDVHVEPFTAAATAAVELSCRRPARRLDRSWRIGSFSQLTARSFAMRPESGHDHDTLAVVPPAAPDEEAEITLAAFPRGAAAGNFFHRLLELAPFAPSAREGRRQLVAEQLRGFGYDPGLWQQPVSAALEDLLATPLRCREGLRLQDIDTARRLNELPFTFPVLAATADKTVTSRSLHRIFSDHAMDCAPEYAARLGSLDFPALAGYLKGFVDLIFEHQGRWYVVDYKSNHLGGRYDEYNPAALRRAMADHHYYLQYHLYIVALHRYLRLRLADYDYERHIGGVFYLFFKGMHPDEPENGIFFDRPPAARVMAITELFFGGGE